MKKWIQKLKKNPAEAFKILGILLLALVFVLMANAFIQGDDFVRELKQGRSMSVSAPSAMLGYDSFDDGYFAEEAALAELSVRNIAPDYQGSIGDLAEAFEVTEYNARIESTNKERDCAVITDLKPREDVIFEQANDSDDSCRYTFKVKNDSVEEILAIVNSLDPKDLNESTYTIQQRIEDFTSEVEILTRKKESVESTLEDAITAYDQISQLAAANGDTETLAKVIDSKIRTIENLTQQRIQINEQLDRIERSKAQQLDRLDFTYFYVNIYENKYIDGEDIKDSWKAAVRDFVDSVNEIVQGVTIGLVAMILFLIQYILYLLILLFVAKYGWKFVKSFWKN